MSAQPFNQNYPNEHKCKTPGDRRGDRIVGNQFSVNGAAGAVGIGTREYPRAQNLALHRYEYRGISQTAEKPAAQFNLDYTHTSGFYLGTFVSNIKWLKETAKSSGFSTSARIEWDLFGGYKFEVVKDITLDVGYLRYEYPSSGAFNPSPNTDEVYVGIVSGPFSAKYSHSTSNLFGFANSKNSTFTEINWAQEVMPKLTANAQVARQIVKNNGDYSYTVYKLGASYDLGDGCAAGAYAKNTNAKEAFYTVNGKDLGKARLVAFVSKSF